MIKITFLTSACLIAMLACPALFGQGSKGKDIASEPSVASQKAAVRSAVLRSVKENLSNYLKPNQYAIQVSFDLPDNLDSYADIPYAPDTILADAITLGDADKLIASAQNLTIKVSIPTWVSGATTKTLENILNEHFAAKLSEANYTISFNQVDLEIKDPSNESSTRVVLPPNFNGLGNTGGNQANQAQKQLLDETKKEVDDLKAEMQKDREALTNQINSLSDELEKTKTAATESAGKGGQGQMNTWQGMMEYASENPFIAILLFIGLYGALFLLAFIPSKLLSSGLKGFQGGLSGIAKAMKAIGDALGKGGSGSSDGAAGGAAAGAAAGVAAGAGGGEVGGEGGGSGSSKGRANPELYSRLKELMDGIRQNYSEDLDGMTLEFINSLLLSSDSKYSAVMALEMLGDEPSDRIFTRLSEDQKIQIVRLVENPLVDRSKPEIMLETAEQFRTKLMARSWKTSVAKKLNSEVVELMNGLENKDFVEVLQGLQKDSAQRFLLYLKSSQIAFAIRELRQKSPERNFVELVSSMPNSLDSDSSDQNIIDTLRKVRTAKDSDQYGLYQVQFEEIVKQSGEEFEDTMIETIAANNASVGKYLRSNIVTIGTFFKLPREMRQELLADFANYDAAVLVSSFEGEQKKTILESFDVRVRELIEEQMEMLADESKLQLQSAQSAAKNRLKEALTNMRKVVDLSEIAEANAAAVDQAPARRSDDEVEASEDDSPITAA